MTENNMRVTKRNGELEEIAFDKIYTRLKKLGQEASIQINYHQLTMKVIDQLYDTISTTKLDELAAEQCAALSTLNPDYGSLASRIVVSNHQKNTSSSFFEVVLELFNFYDVHGMHSPLVSQEVHDFVTAHSNELDNMIDYNRDYLIDYFGFKTLERSYLFKKHKKILERPQHMWMRVSIGIHIHSGAPNMLELIRETYDLMSLKYFTHATPTLFNAGTPRPQLSSCFLLAMEDDSIEGIFNTLKDCAVISKWAGGIGLHVHNIRAKGTHIKGTNGTSNGLVPMLRMFNNAAVYVDQGGGKRNGSFAIYLEPWHADVFDFLEMRKNHGDESLRARDLFYALWMSDLFMERIKANEKWSLFCPCECPGLSDTYGEEFNQLYTSYELSGKAKRTINARELWFAILESQMETGTPYLVYKDAANRKSNQKNLGTIKSSNLCCEIVEYSSKNESAVCNLASIALPAFVTHTSDSEVYFDFDKLHSVAKVITNNLNQVIDGTFYPTEKTKISNLKHRPIGIGVQGLADTFIMMNIAFHSEEAKILNKQIFETIYHAALEKSNELAIERCNMLKQLISSHVPREIFLSNINYEAEYHVCMTRVSKNSDMLGAYSSFEGSPASEGQLQFDLWSFDPTNDRFDWNSLKQSIQKYGIRNSLLVAPMPTASTSQILGYNECFEPFTSNLYMRRTSAGEFVVVNKYLMKELIQIGQWNEQIKNNIIANKGSIQQLTMLPEHIRNKYKIVWEIPMKHLIDMAADRAPFICQSQSLNLWMDQPVYNKLTSMHFYAWEKGLKTGIYYLRRKGKHNAQQFTIEPELTKGHEENFDDNKDDTKNDNVCGNEDGVCQVCSA